MKEEALKLADEAEEVLHMLESWGEAYPTDIFLEITKEDIEYINAVNPNLSSKFFAHVGRHFIKKGFKPAQDMIRKLVAELDKKQKEIQNLHMDELVRLGQELDAPQTKPLSWEEIGLITTDNRWSHIETPLLADLIRYVEERHGIK